MISSPKRMRVVALGAVVALTLTACGGASTSSAPSAAAPSAGAPSAAAPSLSAASAAPSSAAAPKPGGTIYISSRPSSSTSSIRSASTPARISPSSARRSSVAGVLQVFDGPGRGHHDHAGHGDGPRHGADGAKTWTFTLRDGITFQDGSPITCEDVAYGTSRTFAQEVMSQGPTYAIAYLDIPSDPKGGSRVQGPVQEDRPGALRQGGHLLRRRQDDHLPPEAARP